MIKPEQLNQLKEQFSHLFKIEENGNMSLKENFGITPFKLIFIQEGEFYMGKADKRRKVELSPYLMAEFPVTQELYKSVTGINPSTFEGNNHPVEQVSWYDAVEFCQLLNQKLKIIPGTYIIDKENKDPNNQNKNDELKWSVSFNQTGKGFRLPTEAEWEFAAKGVEVHNKGEIFKYAGSNFLNEVGWYNENKGEETKTVGLKFPNSHGIYDLSGNVWEWCWDWQSSTEKKLVKNPTGPINGSLRVLKGGSWFFDKYYCLIENRNVNAPFDIYNIMGFRLVFAF